MLKIEIFKQAKIPSTLVHLLIKLHILHWYTTMSDNMTSSRNHTHKGILLKMSKRICKSSLKNIFPVKMYLFKILFLLLLIMCRYMCLYVNTYRCFQRSEVSATLELELQSVVSISVGN